ncbi:hypothetical protein [Sulfuriflexus mobilis]|uniref:hypothetical protein n=1 Tax=Sulfuriflexus mobilis TaxID=1811807 RepID=UPI000F82000D|nr:hypothetical protein [Sulfuriflexus mobilis]
MQVGSANSNLIVQLSQALQSSAQHTVRQIQVVQSDIQSAKDQVLKSAVQQTVNSAELKGRLIDVTV